MRELRALYVVLALAVLLLVVSAVNAAGMMSVGTLMQPTAGDEGGGSGPPADALLAEDGTPLLNEDGNFLLTEA